MTRGRHSDYLLQGAVVQAKVDELATREASNVASRRSKIQTHDASIARAAERVAKAQQDP